MTIFYDSLQGRRVVNDNSQSLTNPRRTVLIEACKLHPSNRTLIEHYDKYQVTLKFHENNMWFFNIVHNNRHRLWHHFVYQGVYQCVASLFSNKHVNIFGWFPKYHADSEY